MQRLFRWRRVLYIVTTKRSVEFRGILHASCSSCIFLLKRKLDDFPFPFSLAPWKRHFSRDLGGWVSEWGCCRSVCCTASPPTPRDQPLPTAHKSQHNVKSSWSEHFLSPSLSHVGIIHSPWILYNQGKQMACFTFLHCYQLDQCPPCMYTG